MHSLCHAIISSSQHILARHVQQQQKQEQPQQQYFSIPTIIWCNSVCALSCQRGYVHHRKSRTQRAAPLVVLLLFLGSRGASGCGRFVGFKYTMGTGLDTEQVSTMNNWYLCRQRQCKRIDPNTNKPTLDDHACLLLLVNLYSRAT